MSKKRKHILIAGVVIVVLVLVILAGQLFRDDRRDGGDGQAIPRAPQQPTAHYKDIYVLTLDTTRADRIGAYGYAEAKTPNIDRFSRQSVLFSQAISPVPMTLPAHCSLFTGLYPPAHGVRSNANFQLPASVETLAEKLKGHGYGTMGVVSSFTVDSRFGIGRGFDYYDDRLDNSQKRVKTFSSERRANTVIESFRRKLPEFDRQPLFCWLHFFDPHAPYDPPGMYALMFPDQRYDGEISYMDHWIGQAFATIDARRADRERFTVIAGDHGEAFGEHGEFGHQIFCYQQNIHIPLIVTALGPSAFGTVIDDWISLVDVKPTILEVLPTAVPAMMQGHSLAGFLRGDREAGSRDGQPLYFESLDAHYNLGYAPITGALLDDVKVIDVPDREIFNLREDPRERSNLRELEGKETVLPPDMPETLRSFAASVRESGNRVGDTARRTLSADESKQLQALGYLSPDSAVSGVDAADAMLSDAKELRSILEQFNLAQEAEKVARFDEAVSLYKGILALSPCYTPAILRLAAFLQTRSPESALAILQTARNDCPENKHFIPDYVNLLIELGHYEQATRLLGEERPAYFALPENEVAYWFLSGSLHEKQAAIPEAIAAFKKSWELEPENKFLGARIAGLHLQSGDISSALHIYKKLVADFPEDVDIMFNTGVLYARSADFPQAEFFIKNAVSRNPLPYRYFELAFVLAQQQKFGEAVEAMQQYLGIADTADPRRVTAREMIDSWRTLQR